MLSPLFGQDLDPNVIVFMRSTPIVIPVYLPVQNNGGRSRRQWLARHLDLIGRNGLEANTRPRRPRRQHTDRKPYHRPLA
jgi:hypothetical protein